MDDEKIVALFFARDEAAIAKTQEKYAAYCMSIAVRILGSQEDAEECVNDAYHRAWDSIPPQKPSILSSYMGMLTRRISLNRARERRAAKRGNGELTLILDELQECIPDPGGESADDFVIRDALNAFLASLPQRTRIIFLRRYWYADSVHELAQKYRMSPSSIHTLLSRTRQKLESFLREQQIYL